MASGSDDGTVRLWDAASSLCMAVCEVSVAFELLMLAAILLAPWYACSCTAT